jgi:hypothetical protein
LPIFCIRGSELLFKPLLATSAVPWLSFQGGVCSSVPLLAGFTRFLAGIL